MSQFPATKMIVESDKTTKEAPVPVHPRRTTLFVFGTFAILAVGGLFLAGYMPRARRLHTINQMAQEETDALPVVNVVKVKRAPTTSELLLPGNISALIDTPIYARASGYLIKKNVDIGDRVKAGQVLGVIDAPEIDQQVSQAQATLAQSKAALGQVKAQLVQSQSKLKLAGITLERWSTLVGKGVLSKQEGDQRQAEYDTAKADVEAGQANVRAAEENVRASEANLERLRQVQGFKNLKAPFDGIITVRNVTLGAYVSSNGSLQGASSSGNPISEIYRMAQIDVLRIFINVPESNAPSIKVGQKAQLTLSEFPHRVFTGEVTRTSNSLDPNTRTMLTEVQVKNADHTLLPGMFANVKFISTQADPPFLIPGEAVVTRAEGTQVALLGPGNKVHFQKIEVGRDYGTDLEVSNGLKGGETVIVNPGDEVREGVQVKPATAKNASHPK